MVNVALVTGGSGALGGAIVRRLRREAAEVAAFLASDKAAHVNAQNIFVDGGI